MKLVVTAITRLGNTKNLILTSFFGFRIKNCHIAAIVALLTPSIHPIHEVRVLHQQPSPRLGTE
jgi:hypothetical protein